MGLGKLFKKIWPEHFTKIDLKAQEFSYTGMQARDHPIHMEVKRMICLGNRHKNRSLDSQLWADYHLIVASYLAVIDDKEQMKLIIEGIKETFPDYDPSTRFELKSSKLILLDEKLAQEWQQQIYLENLPVRKLNQFKESYPMFSLFDTFSKYFKMSE